jgi:small conductance mechanosensitive channel
MIRLKRFAVLVGLMGFVLVLSCPLYAQETAEQKADSGWSIGKLISQLQEFVTRYGLKIIGAVLILIIGRIAASIVRRITRKALTKRRTEDTIVSFFSTLTYALVMAFIALAALATLGVQTASFVAVLGAAAFAIGFALQGSLSNFAAGVMILVFRPYKVDDFIEAAGVAGVVREVRVFSTIIDTPDNIRIIVPNSKIYGDVIKNVTGNDTRRVDLVIGIGYSSPIGEAIEVAMNVMKQDERILDDPEPQVAVSELADSSVNLVVRPWVKKEDYWAVRFDITRKIKEAFDESDIEIPFPQHVVHMASAEPGD